MCWCMLEQWCVTNECFHVVVVSLPSVCFCANTLSKCLRAATRSFYSAMQQTFHLVTCENVSFFFFLFTKFDSWHLKKMIENSKETDKISMKSLLNQGKTVQVKSNNERFCLFVCFSTKIKKKKYFRHCLLRIFFFATVNITEIQLAFNTLCWLATEICPAAYYNNL